MWDFVVKVFLRKLGIGPKVNSSFRDDAVGCNPVSNSINRCLSRKIARPNRGICIPATRAKENMDARRVYSYPADRANGIICDQRVMLNGFYSAEHYPDHLRRIRFNDPVTGKTLVFLTNNTALPALTIAALYKSRWQIELFLWIKQHLRIKRFLATSENAVRTQIWCAVATYVLIAIVRKELKLDASLYTCLQILSVSIFEKTEISCTLQPYLHRTDQPAFANQLNLFDI
jgi:hypothetical protein